MPSASLICILVVGFVSSVLGGATVLLLADDVVLTDKGVWSNFTSGAGLQRQKRWKYETNV